MSRRAPKPAGWILAAATALVAVAVLFLYSDYRSAAQRHRNTLLERGEALGEALTAGMRAQGRMARARGDRINVLYEEAARIPGVLGVRLSRSDGTTVNEHGTVKDLPSPPPDTPLWEGASVTMAVAAELPPLDDPHTGESHGGPWQAVPTAESLPTGSYVITMALDATSVHRDVLHERVRFGVALVVAVCAVAAAVGLLLLQTHRLALESDLALTRELAAENERLAQLGAGLAHETKNPLNVVRGLAQRIVDTTAVANDAHTDATCIVDEVDRTVGHINAFLTLSRPKAAQLAPLPLDPFLNELVSLVRPEAEAKGITLEVISSGEAILVDAELLRRGMLNLLINALRACRPACRVRVEALTNGTYTDLCVTDDGCGIAPEDITHVKEPYFSRFEGGTGLGLAIVEQIARAHAATLVILPRQGGGTRARLNGFRKVE
ncbi:MAG: ATP-binding protein [Candidatus Hydrogenedentales bacterium]